MQFSICHCWCLFIHNGTVRMPIWGLPTRSQSRISFTQVTVMATEALAKGGIFIRKRSTFLLKRNETSINFSCFVCWRLCLTSNVWSSVHPMFDTKCLNLTKLKGYQSSVSFCWYVSFYYTFSSCLEKWNWNKFW